MTTAFFPFIAALFYGLGYVLLERTLHHFTIVSFLLMNGMMGIIVALSLWILKRDTFLTGVPFDKNMLAFFVLAGLVPSLGWLFTIYSVKSTSAVYAAMGEISYPLFTLLFAFLLFGVRSWSLTTLLGGGIIMIGSFILVYGQMRAKGG